MRRPQRSRDNNTLFPNPSSIPIAGCVYNDLVDRGLEAKVARTASRPVASGAVSVVSALLWTLCLTLIGLPVLLQLPGPARIVALASLILVAAYPFMKRITW